MNIIRRVYHFTTNNNTGVLALFKHFNGES